MLKFKNIKFSTMMLATVFVFSISIMTLSAAIYFSTRAEAITTTNLRSRIDIKRFRVTHADVINAPSVDGNPAVKRVTLFTMAGGDQILSMVTNTPVAFTLPTGENVSIYSVKPEINGQVVSDYDIINPPPVSQAEFQNDRGNVTEFLFFSETQSTNIVVTFATDGIASLNNLSQGTIDFYVTMVN